MIDAADETSVRRVDLTMSHPPLLTVIARNPNRRRANFSKPRNVRIPSVRRVAASFGALDPIADGFQLGGKREAYPFRDFTPHIKRLFDVYGPKRCYWGSDITNGYDKATYKQRVTHFTEELSFLSEEDKDSVMGKSILDRLNWA